MHPDDDRAAEIQSLLRALDHPVPAVTAEAIAARVRATASPAPGWRWAAAVLLTLGVAGAAFALPGSPLRRWASAFAAAARGRSAAASDSALASEIQSPPGGRAGIAVPPGRSLLIDFTRPSPTAVALVSLVDGAEVVVRAPAGAATFTTGPDRLAVEVRDAASSGLPGALDTITIEVPRASPRVEIRAGPTRLFLKQGHRITAPPPSALGQPWWFPLGTASASP